MPPNVELNAELMKYEHIIIMSYFMACIRYAKCHRSTTATILPGPNKRNHETGDYANFSFDIRFDEPAVATDLSLNFFFVFVFHWGAMDDKH